MNQRPKKTKSEELLPEIWSVLAQSLVHSLCYSKILYCKFPKYLDTQKVVVITLKLNKMAFP